ncbi:hypothetical protein ACFE04_025081 [Oxalis oulophora]
MALMLFKNQSFLLFLIPFIILFPLLTFSSSSPPYRPTVTGGRWVVLQTSVGVSAMHMQVLNNNKVIFFDRTDMGPSNLSLPSSVACRNNDEILKPDCTAHSAIYDIVTNTFRPLTIQTDAWCSSGAVDANGTLIQTGGYHGGEHVIRTFEPCNDDTSDWVEYPGALKDRRWYASNQILPDGRIIVIGGRRAFTYEFYPKTDGYDNAVNLRFLVETRDPGEENNLYPFLHLLPDGNLFVFANKKSILLDYKNNIILKRYPDIPGQDKRNYPSTGSSVLLPLRLTEETLVVEVMICGGAPNGAYNMSNINRVFLPASSSCGRLKLSDPHPAWVMEDMPMPRVMPDMLILPTGDVILINGAGNGTAGWEDAVNPVLNPVLYMPREDPTRRFVILNPTSTARMYHSSALLMPDGRILVGGSNPHRNYNFTAYPYPTELSLEAFNPYYLDSRHAPIRASILTIETGETMSYGGTFSVTFVLSMYMPNRGIEVSIITPSFSTHSFAMNQRMVVLNIVGVTQLSTVAYKVSVNGPTNANVLPPGYHMLFVVHAGIPSVGVWVKVA